MRKIKGKVKSFIFAKNINVTHTESGFLSSMIVGLKKNIQILSFIFDTPIFF